MGGGPVQSFKVRLAHLFYESTFELFWKDLQHLVLVGRAREWEWVKVFAREKSWKRTHLFWISWLTPHISCDNSGNMNYIILSMIFWNLRKTFWTFFWQFGYQYTVQSWLTPHISCDNSENMNYIILSMLFWNLRKTFWAIFWQFGYQYTVQRDQSFDQYQYQIFLRQTYHFFCPAKN